MRNEVRSGLGIGFERSASIAFVIEQDDVVVLRLLAKGQEFKEEAQSLWRGEPPAASLD